MKRTKFPKDIKLMQKIAWSFHNTTGIQFEELLSEAIIGYYEALQTYSKEHDTKISTHAWVYMRNRLINFCKQEEKHTNLSLDCEIVQDALSYLPRYVFNNESPLKLSEEKAFLISLVLDNFDTLDVMPPKKARGFIVQELRKHEWSWPKIWREIKDIKQCLDEILPACII